MTISDIIIIVIMIITIITIVITIIIIVIIIIITVIILSWSQCLRLIMTILVASANLRLFFPRLAAKND